MIHENETTDQKLESMGRETQPEEPQAATSIIDKFKKLIRQFGGRYLIVGFSSAAIELGLFEALYRLFGMPRAGVLLVIANVVAICVATVYNFILSRNWTFRSTSRLTRSIILFVVLFAWNQVFSNTVILLLVGININEILAKVFTMACIVCWNFFLYRFVVFK